MVVCEAVDLFLWEGEAHKMTTRGGALDGASGVWTGLGLLGDIADTPKQRLSVQGPTADQEGTAQYITNVE